MANPMMHEDGVDREMTDAEYREWLDAPVPPAPAAPANPFQTLLDTLLEKRLLTLEEAADIKGAMP